MFNTMQAPEAISGRVISFVRTIHPTNRPIYIDVVPDGNAHVAECFSNCRENSKKTSSEVILGWAIWERKRYFFEAEHHAVVMTHGEMTCVTPHLDGTKRILFLPDETATVDSFNKSTTRTSKFHNISGKDFVDKFIKARTEFINASKYGSLDITTMEKKREEYRTYLAMMR